MYSKFFRILIISILLFSGTSFRVYSQEFIIKGKQSDTITPEVSFLETPPVIDGQLDANLNTLAKRHFNYLLKFNKNFKEADVSYRVAYGTAFLYLFITLKTEKLNIRDRAYQNGDGFILVLNQFKTTGQVPTEYYVLAFSPGSDQFPRQAFVWNYNGTWPFMPLSEASQFKVRSKKGKVHFEVLLSWKDVYPYHPWLSAKMGFNLIFSKASGETDLGWYSVSANKEKKNVDFTDHQILQFQKPVLKKGTQTYLVLERNHLHEGQTVNIETVSVSAALRKERLWVVALTGEGSYVNRIVFPFETVSGITFKTFKLDTTQFLSGGYQIKWLSMTSDSRGDTTLTVFPHFNEKNLKNKLENLKSNLTMGSLNTLMFMMKDIIGLKDQLLDHDHAGKIRIRMHHFLRLIRQAENKNDVIAKKKGYVRRAFVSKVNNTLQPYTVKIPEKYDSSRKYPAIVFLHGSDVDDTAVKRHFYIGTEDFIIIAPNGRGPQTAYIANHAQEDIQEAITDAVNNYAIDETRLILTGFSMGGYGVYRTFYETPKKYCAAAIFSGDPNLANRYLPGNKQPNFLNEKYLTVFKGARIAIFHGKKDRNCPFELTDKIVKKLKTIGAEVMYHVDQNVGHSPPRDKDILKAYYKWLKDSVK